MPKNWGHQNSLIDRGVKIKGSQNNGFYSFHHHHHHHHHRVARPYEITWLCPNLSSPGYWIRLSIYCIALEQSLFHVNYNKHSNQLTKSYKIVNDEHIQSPGPQAAKSCNFNSSARSKSKIIEANFSFPDFTLTFSIFPDFSLTTLEFPDFSRFSRWVATLHHHHHHHQQQ